jgi:hypothetical protein
MKMYGDWRYNSMRSSPQDWMMVSLKYHAPGCLTPEERAASAHCIGSWVDPRAGLGVVEKNLLPLLGIER